MYTTQPIDATRNLAQDSAQVRALLQLREWVLSGELPGGQRIAELALVQRLGVSRTPVRAALARLEQEGLLRALPSGGYAVQAFSEADIADGIELRGTLEGLMARRAAERGVGDANLDAARALLRGIDALLQAPTLDAAGFAAYVDRNAGFHQWLRACADSPVLARQLDRVNQLPFASPSAFVIAQAETALVRDRLVVAQDQHWQVLEAVAQREGSRAEALMREHSRIAQRNLREALRSANPRQQQVVRLVHRERAAGAN